MPPSSAPTSLPVTNGQKPPKVGWGAVVARGVVASGALAIVGMVVVVALLSDRAPGFGQSVKVFLIDVGQAFERAFGVDWFDRDSVPGTFDQIGHAVLWACAMLVLGLAFRRWVAPLLMACLVAAASLLLEVLQGIVTTSREVDVMDFVANSIGIAAALVVVLFVGLVVDVVARWRKKSARD